MLINNSRFILKSAVSQTQWEWTTFYISPDLETGKYIDTDWNQVPIVLQNNAYIERLLVTMENWIATIIKRWLGKKVDEAWNVDMQFHWMPSTIGYITSLAQNQIDIDDADYMACIKAWIDFKGEVNFNNDVSFKTLTLPAYTSVETRDIAYPAPKNWDKCILIWTGEQIFSGGVWNTLWISTPVPDATTTIAGKVQIATEDEYNAWNDIWSSGAYLVAPLSWWKSKYLGNKHFTCTKTDNVIYEVFDDIPLMADYALIEYSITHSWENHESVQVMHKVWMRYFRYVINPTPLTVFFMHWDWNVIKYRLTKDSTYTWAISVYISLNFYKY